MPTITAVGAIFHTAKVSRSAIYRWRNAAGAALLEHVGCTIVSEYADLKTASQSCISLLLHIWLKVKPSNSLTR